MIKRLKRIINKLKSIKLIKTKEQKDNNAKFCYDIAKINFALFIIGPITKPEEFNFLIVIWGFVVTIIFYIFGNLIDRKKFES
ncbi:MAG: hypothetical protein FVQ77_09420 [Cytophagales bacterium]|nr:hypothetical protein [Cytophagales bacterium]